MFPEDELPNSLVFSASLTGEKCTPLERGKPLGRENTLSFLFIFHFGGITGVNRGSVFPTAVLCDRCLVLHTNTDGPWTSSLACSSRALAAGLDRSLSKPRKTFACVYEVVEHNLHTSSSADKTCNGRAGLGMLGTGPASVAPGVVALVVEGITGFLPSASGGVASVLTDEPLELTKLENSLRWWRCDCCAYRRATRVTNNSNAPHFLYLLTGCCLSLRSWVS